MKDLRGKNAIVTGASRGIGRAITESLAQEGVSVSALGRDESALADLVASCEGITSRAFDIRDEASVRAAVDDHATRYGGIDILINNAGIGAFGLLEDVEYADLLETLEVNVGGTFLFMKAALPKMKAQGDGDIVNISSVVGVKGYAEQSAYGASKHAVIGLTKAAAVEAHPYGVRVRSVCPGGTDTELIGKARPDLDRSGLIQVEDISATVLFLLRMSGSGVVDNVNLRRAGSDPWF